MKTIDKKTLFSYIKTAVVTILIICAIILPCVGLYATAEESEKIIYVTEAARTIRSSRAVAYGICEDDFASVEISPDDYIKFSNGTYSFNENYVVTGKYIKLLDIFTDIVDIKPYVSEISE